uniref:RFX-type winged-helix domain-containing protein n=1 Tax=Scylla olivacea TaxID=85551 RepID=A0A0P4WCA8_SCYOL
MVAETMMTVLPLEKLADEAVKNRRDSSPAAVQPYQDYAGQQNMWGLMKKKANADEGEQSDSDQETDVLVIKEESEHESQSLHLVSVGVEKTEDNEDEAEVSPLGVPKCSLPWHSDDSIQCKKLNGILSRVKKSKQRMFHAKQWITDCLLPVATSISMVSLEDIEKAYINDCHKKGQEPLNTFVLARLIHQECPEADKCRRGSRGSQKIHYRKLQLRSGSSPNLKDATSTFSENKAEGEIPSEDLPSPAEAQTRDENPPPPNTSSVGVAQAPRQVENEIYCEANEAIEGAAHQPLPEDDDRDQKGCQDAAERFAQVVKSVKLEGKFDMLLKIFAHSASCSNSSCNPLCLMFRRVRRHVVNARHPCFVMRIYSVLLKLHVARCNNTNCGMTACPALQASRQMKRGRDEEFQEELQHQQYDEPQRITKRFNLQMKRIRIPSPPSSLPDSQPNTPSPPVSPFQPPSPRIVPLVPVEVGRVAKIHTEHGGA